MEAWAIAVTAVLAAAAAVVLPLWRGDRARARALAAEERWAARVDGLDEMLRERDSALDLAESERAQLRSDGRRLGDDLAERERELELERARTERLRRAAEFERRLVRQLRDRLAELHREQGRLGDTSDVRALVLRIALKLLDAEKGLLLSRTDGDGDGRLDLVWAEGFQHDPEGSGVAQHFAAEVIERDRTVHEDDVTAIAGESRTAADDEIENLVAIPIWVHDTFSGVIVAANNENGFADLDDDVLLAIGDHAGAVLQNARLRGDVRSSYLGTVRVLADAIEAKDRLLRTHSDEVSAYVTAVANRLALEPSRREELVFASLLHDVGKIGISERILLKPAALTPEERAVVELHPRIGCRLIEQVPALRSMAQAILHHHERFDGGGYPGRLRGEQIPLEARIICVADSFSAMTAERPYREAMTLDEACAELERAAGMQFDPEIVRLFCEEVRRRPPAEGEADSLSLALADPELRARVGETGRILGFGSFAAVDNVTLLYSHRYFHEVARAECERAAAQGRPFGVVVVELGLTELNRAHGYAAGDAALQAAAATLQREAARCGGIAARHGGGRLALLGPRLDEREAEHVRDTLVAELAAGAAGAHVGAAAWREGDSAEDLVARARAQASSDRAVDDVLMRRAADAARS